MSVSSAMPLPAGPDARCRRYAKSAPAPNPHAQGAPPPSASSNTRSPRRAGLPPVSPGFGQRQRHRGGGGVGVAVNRHHDPVLRQPQLAAHRVDDALIRLMRHQPVDVPPGQAVGGKASSTASARRVTAWRNTSRPFITKWPGLSRWPTAPSTYRMSPRLPLRVQVRAENALVARRCLRRRAGTPRPRRRRTTRRCRDPRQFRMRE